MIIFDELHVVTAILDGQEHRLVMANLCGDIDTLDGVRLRVLSGMASLAPHIPSEEAGEAFDRAFAECESRAGNMSTATTTVHGCDIVVTRSLEGAS